MNKEDKKLWNKCMWEACKESIPLLLIFICIIGGGFVISLDYKYQQEKIEVPRPIDNYLLNLEYQQVNNYIASEARYLSYSPSDYMTNYGKHKAKYEAEIIQRNWYQLIKQNNKTSTEDDPIEIFMIELEYVMIKFILGRNKHHEEELENYEAVLNG